MHKEMEQQHSPRVVSSPPLANVAGKCMKIVLFDALIHRDTWRSCVHTVKMRMWSNTVTCRLGVALCTVLNVKCRITKKGSTVSLVNMSVFLVLSLFTFAFVHLSQPDTPSFISLFLLSNPVTLPRWSVCGTQATLLSWIHTMYLNLHRTGNDTNTFVSRKNNSTKLILYILV